MHDHVGVTEKELQLYWLSVIERGTRLSLSGGGEAEVLSPGVLNRDAGPDFSNARLRIDGRVWAGDVEMHRRASDWYRHGHQHDEAYGAVVLHVVLLDDGVVTAPDGQPLPQTVLAVPAHFAESVRILSVPGEPYMRCAAIKDFWRSLSPLQIRDWIETLYAERFRLKSDSLLQIHNRFNGDWRQTAFAALARALGFGINADAMEALALSVPLNVIEHHSSSLFQIEALLFGQAGMLAACDHLFDEYYQALAREYGFLAHKYGLSPMYGSRWKLARTRPANFPYRRISQLAAYCHGGFSLLGDLLECSGDPDRIAALFRREPSQYWHSHYKFDTDAVCAPQSVTAWACRMMTINAAVPLLFAYGRRENRPALIDDAEKLLHALPPETVARMKVWKQAGAPVETAADTQALHHLFAKYCSHNRCLECRLGARLLRYWAGHPIEMIEEGE